MASSIKVARLPVQLAVKSSFRSPACSSIASAVLRQRTPVFAALERYYASKSFPSHSVINMPALSPTMTAGNIGSWQKTAGDSVAPGDVLVEIETDKAQMDFEFQEEGVIAKILKDSGSKDVAVGSPIAVMIEEGGDISAFKSFTIDDAGGEKEAPKEAPKEEASESSEPADSGSGTSPPKGNKKSEGKEEKSTSEDDSSSPKEVQESESTGDRLQTALDRAPKISPAAKRLALEKGVAIGSVKGTGKGGQVTKEDIEKFKGSSSAPTAAGPAAAVAAGGATYEDIPASSMRKTIANRLTQSMQQNPHYFVQSTISVTKLLKLRAALNASANGSYKLSVNDLVIKAIALAALKVPAANSSWREIDGQTVIRQHNVADVSVAVATPIGLMTPIVRNANTLGLEAISATVKDFGKRAKDGKLKPEEYQGGTITVSNMGMNDAIDRFTAVINPPQAAIIAVGTVKKVAVPDSAGAPGEDGGQPGIRWDEQIVFSGSFDHKVVDGAVGGEYMRALKSIIEDPLKMLL